MTVETHLLNRDHNGVELVWNHAVDGVIGPLLWGGEKERETDKVERWNEQVPTCWIIKLFDNLVESANKKLQDKLALESASPVTWALNGTY